MTLILSVNKCIQLTAHKLQSLILAFAIPLKNPGGGGPKDSCVCWGLFDGLGERARPTLVFGYFKCIIFQGGVGEWGVRSPDFPLDQRTLYYHNMYTLISSRYDI